MSLHIKPSILHLSRVSYPLPSSEEDAAGLPCGFATAFGSSVHLSNGQI